jgi:peptidoglycan/xylan/chitin deacetylase (PgdA/CDA1 family)
MTLTPSAVPRKSWRPTPLISGSAVLGAAAIVATVVRPHVWPWTLATVVADHLLLTGLGLWPRSQLLGSNWTHLPASATQCGAVAITIDDGPNPDITPRVLQLLDDHQVKATFFCIGDKVRRYAETAREIVRRGHAIENHSQRHVHNFSVMGFRGLTNEISRAQDTISEVTGIRPLFFRAPAGLRNPLLDPVLSHLDLQLASWTRRGFDTVTNNPEKVLGKLTRNLAKGDILLLHDGNAKRPVILEVLPRLLARISGLGLQPITLRAALT